MNALTDEIHKTADLIESLSAQLDPLDRDVFFNRCAFSDDPKTMYAEIWYERVNARDFGVYVITEQETLQEIYDRFTPPFPLERFAFINNIADLQNPPVGLLITLKDVK